MEIRSYLLEMRNQYLYELLWPLGGLGSPMGAAIHRLPAFWILHVSCIGQLLIQHVGRYLLVRGIEMIRQELLRGR